MTLTMSVGIRAPSVLDQNFFPIVEMVGGAGGHKWIQTAIQVMAAPEEISQWEQDLMIEYENLRSDKYIKYIYKSINL